MRLNRHAPDTPQNAHPLMRSSRLMLFFHLLVLLLAISSCARMGEPDGGWYDEEPPKILGSSPADRAVNITGNKITIYFNEYIKLDNPTEKVVVSPPQLEMPEIKGQGKRITVELKDSLKPNTTYTIDFSDAISDNNENNPLGNYTFTFSTGDAIDTLEVSGYVLEAENLEPVKGILVGLYRDLADSAFQQTEMLRVSRTDSRGRFVIKGIASGSYRIYALQDMDGNYKFSQKSEKLAFSRDIITPTSKPDIRQDTIWTDSLHIKAINRVGYTHFLPDDIVLRAFTETQTDRYLIKIERKEANHFTLFFSSGDSGLPAVKGLNFNDRDAFLVEANEKKDTISYWLRDTTLINQDTLRMEVQYMMTDSTGALQPQTDTLDVLSKVSYTKRMKDKEKEREKWEKKQEKAKKNGDPYETEMPAEPLAMKFNAPSNMDPDKNILIESPTPLARIDTAAIHLYAKHDTLWYRAPFELIAQDNRHCLLRGEWRTGIEYSLEIDSTAFCDIYNTVSAKYKHGFKVRSDDEYSSVFINLSGMGDTAVIVQLLNGSDNLVKETKAAGGTAEFYYIMPGTYYLRAFIDSNNNGRWDTGDYAAGRQAETVYYYPEKIECRAKWDVTKNWSPAAVNTARQKPSAITKQKPEQEKKIKRQNIERAKKLGIEYLNN